MMTTTPPTTSATEPRSHFLDSSAARSPTFRARTSSIAAGASPLEVSRQAGHSSTSFTLVRYRHLFPDADASVADRLEELRQQPVHGA